MTVTVGDVVDTVIATGSLEAVTTVQVGSQVSGIIQDLYVDYDSIVRAAAAELKSARAQVVQARAALRQHEVNLGHTVIRAPIDGIVISRLVDVGQTVAASLQAPELFVIAADLTKMRVIANVDESDVGRIRPGQRVTFTVDAYPAEQFAGAVSQVRLEPVVQQNVVTYATVIDAPNVELPLLYRGGGLRAAERRRRARDMLTAVGLGDRLHHLPNQLSGGQQQRVAIARALINRPAIVAADEPTGNLDSQTSIEVMELFRRLNAENGITIVLITHEREIAAWGDRVIRFRDGAITADAPAY